MHVESDMEDHGLVRCQVHFNQNLSSRFFEGFAWQNTDNGIFAFCSFSFSDIWFSDNAFIMKVDFKKEERYLKTLVLKARGCGAV